MNRVDEDVLRRVIENRPRTSTEYDHCGSDRTVGYGEGCHYPSLAMVYTPHQSFCDLYSEEKGFVHGTIFSELDKPFTPCMKRNERGGNCNGCKM